jgi:succinoglycan biosynthesis protein ExoW
MVARIAVVIPFYQREHGILRRAVAAALAQEGIEPIQIFIVDDGSPVRARAELADLADQPGQPVIVEQSNRGPGAARNAGLDRVDTRTEYIAFLDSDDEWTPTHLQRAMTTLDRGFDLYFSDFQPLGAFATDFMHSGARAALGASLGDGLHAYAGDLADAVITKCPIGTSTVVYRFGRFPALRFDPELRMAGEDRQFWLELSRGTDRVAISTHCEARYGAGVNTYEGAGWGTERALQRICADVLFRRRLLAGGTLNARQAAYLRQQLRQLRGDFVAEVAHRLAHRRSLDLAACRRYLRYDPAVVALAVPLALGLAARRARRHHSR